MGLQLTIDVNVVESELGGGDAVQGYIDNLKTPLVMFINGPESPGPCLRCLQFHRTLWSKTDTARPRPPLHPHCYCRVISYRDNADIKRGGLSPLKPTDWLTKQIEKWSMKQREDFLGKGIARLHRFGIIDTPWLVNSTSGITSLEQILKSKLNITLEQFNKLGDGELLKLYESLSGK